MEWKRRARFERGPVESPDVSGRWKVPEQAVVARVQNVVPVVERNAGAGSQNMFFDTLRSCMCGLRANSVALFLRFVMFEITRRLTDFINLL